MERTLSNDRKVLLCPLASLCSLSISRANKEMLDGCFLFDDEVRPGWIRYNPEKITVITSNEMFKLQGRPSGIVHSRKQMLTIRTSDDVATLEVILDKPVLLCVTRRHYVKAPVVTLDLDTDAATLPTHQDTVNGFDMDFAVIFPPADLKQKLKEILTFARQKIEKGHRFSVMIDLKALLDDWTPSVMQSKDSLEYISWHNTAFWVTNHCKPHHSLMYVNNLLFWIALFPYAFFAALPYRLCRRILCTDKRVLLENKMHFTVGNAEDKVLVCTWSSETPSPGEYQKHEGRFTLRVVELSWFKSLLQNCKALTFDISALKPDSADCKT